MKILLIAFILLTGVIGCSSKSKKETATVQTPSPSAIPPKETQPLPNNSAAVDTKSATSKVLKETTCKRDSEIRNLSIEEVSPKGCQLMYSNFNPKKPVAWSSKSSEHCESVMERIKGKLEAANYKCQ